MSKLRSIRWFALLIVMFLMLAPAMAQGGDCIPAGSVLGSDKIEMGGCSGGPVYTEINGEGPIAQISFFPRENLAQVVNRNGDVTNIQFSFPWQSILPYIKSRLPE